MISFIEPLPVGNALRVLLSPSLGTTELRLLRKVADNFTGPTDPDAAVIYDGAPVTSALDTASLTNGTPYYYREYDLVGGVFQASATVSATPAAAETEDGPDVLELVRARLEAALMTAVQANILTHEWGYVPCLTAPPAWEDTVWPVVTIHLRTDNSEVRGIGEEVVPPFASDASDWLVSYGWLSRVQLHIMGWSLNADARIALRKALKRAIIGNLPVFDDAGMVQIDVQFSDTEEFEAYPAPVYQNVCTFSCLAPTVVGSDIGAITEVDTSLSVSPEFLE